MIVYNNINFYLGRLGYYVSKSKKAFPERQTTFLHRYIWEQHYGPIPDGYVIHHRDGNRQNNDLTNLELIHHCTHQTLHRIQEYKKGRREQMVKLGERTWKDPFIRYKRCEGLKKAWLNRKSIRKKCELCSSGFKTKMSNARFCSRQCQIKRLMLIKKADQNQMVMNF